MTISVNLNAPTVVIGQIPSHIREKKSIAPNAEPKCL